MPLRFASFAMFAAFAFVIALMALHIVRSDLPPSQHMISEYAVGRHGWIMAVAFFALATSFISLAVAFIPSATGILGRLALVTLVVAGVGAAFGGLFPMDPAGTPPDQFSTSGKLHGVGFMLGVPGTLLAVTLLSIYLWRQPEWQPVRPMLALTAAAVWLLMIVFGASMSKIMSTGANDPSLRIGVQNRALVLSWATWVFLVASRLRFISRE